MGLIDAQKASPVLASMASTLKVLRVPLRLPWASIETIALQSPGTDNSRSVNAGTVTGISHCFPAGMIAHFMPPGRVHDSPSLAASRGIVEAEETILEARKKKSARMTGFTYGDDSVFLSNNLVHKILWGFIPKEK